MDKDRQLRLLIPPFFLVASLLWVAFLHGALDPYLAATLQGSDTAYLKIGLSAFGLLSIVTLPLGYVIGVVTISILRTFDRYYDLKRHDIIVSRSAIDEVWKRLGIDRKNKEPFDFYAAVLIDHVYIQPKMHEWVVRRWTAFHIATQCITSLILSVLITICVFCSHGSLSTAFQLPNTWIWLLSVTVLCLVLRAHAVATWRELRGLYDFAVKVPMAFRQSKTDHTSLEVDIAGDGVQGLVSITSDAPQAG